MTSKIKKLINLTVCIAIVLSIIPLTVFASAPIVDRDERIYDFGGYLEYEELESLKETADTYSEELEVDLIAVITDNALGFSPEEYVSSFYQENIFGYNDTNEGVIIYINMVERDIWVGSKGVMESFFLDGRTDQLYQQTGQILNSDSATPYYDAIDGFLNSAYGMVNEYRQIDASVAEDESYDYEESYEESYEGSYEESYDVNTEYNTYDAYDFFWDISYYFEWYLFSPQAIIAALVITLIVMLILVGVQRRGLKNKPSAMSYSQSGIDIRIRVDDFVSTHTTRTSKPKDNDSGSSDSSRSSSSSGGPSGSGGKF